MPGYQMLFLWGSFPLRCCGLGIHPFIAPLSPALCSQWSVAQRSLDQGLLGKALKETQAHSQTRIYRIAISYAESLSARHKTCPATEHLLCLALLSKTFLFFNKNKKEIKLNVSSCCPTIYALTSWSDCKLSALWSCREVTMHWKFFQKSLILNYIYSWEKQL